MNAAIKPTDRRLALEATYELESLLMCLQEAVNKIIDSRELADTSQTAYLARGIIQRALGLNSALMSVATGDEIYLDGGWLSKDIRGMEPKTAAGAH